MGGRLGMYLLKERAWKRHIFAPVELLQIENTEKENCWFYHKNGGGICTSCRRVSLRHWRCHRSLPPSRDRCPGDTGGAGRGEKLLRLFP